MKKLNKYLFFAFCTLIFFGCKKSDNVLNTNVNSVKTLFSPENNQLLDLSTTSSVLFEWDQARAEDGGLVLYSVAFSKVDGNFSNPIYTMPSDGNGLYNKATLTKDVLNKIAKLAGLQPLESAKFKWTVFSSKGVNAVQADSTRIVEIKRPLGIDNPPAQLYITGSATEGGTDLSKAIKLKQTDNGKYEIYTSLKSGTYHFVDNITSNQPNEYYLGSDNIIHEGAGETTVSDPVTKVYHMALDFNLVNAKFQQIKELALWFAGYNQATFNLTYDHDGIWKAKNQLITFHQESWGRDERYKFRMLINDGTSDSYIWWGSINSDNNRPDATTPANFYYLFPVNSSQYDYCFKFRGECDLHNCDVNFYLSPDIANYTHEVIVDQ